MPVALEPLYFAIEEKNKQVDLTDKGIDALTGSSEDPKFFVLPDVGSELAEIEHDESLSKEEKLERKDKIMTEYTTKAERVHAVDQLLKAFCMFDRDVDYVISEDGKVKIVDEQTGRIMEGRRWSDGLHQAVEAKERVKIEATTQTFATITLQNYFRMYHKLSGMTGTAETEAGEFWDIYKLDVVTIPTNRPVARIDMNDRVYKTKRAKYKAVIAQIEEYVKAGRPVLVGTTSVEISETLSKALQLRGIKHNVLNAKLHQREADIVAQAGQTSTVTIATNMAGRGTDIKLSPEVKAAGGLAIIGTERHESRRVDRQLRGRSGRQGDPGSSVFFVSLEDNLMRIFGSDKISKIMDSKMFGMSEDDVIEHSLLNKSIENAQKKVEENNFGIRKRLLEYDDVLNKQREVVYAQRRHALMGERIFIDFMNMAYSVAGNLIEQFGMNNDFEALQLDVLRHFGVEVPFTEDEAKRLKTEEMVEKIYKAGMESFNRHMKDLTDKVTPRLKEIWEQVKEGGQIKNIIIPISDGKRVYQIPVPLQEAAETDGKSISKTFLKVIMLHNIDEAWKQNLRDLDDLKQNTQNASYEQKDPLLIYKLESYHIFERMVTKMNSKAVSVLMRGQLHLPEPTPEEIAQQQAAAAQRQQMQQAAAQRKMAAMGQNKGEEAPSRPVPPPPFPPQFRTAGDQRQRPDFSRMQAIHAGANGQNTVQRKPMGTMPHVGRNDPCPCGSGLKYKNCHGK
jgi:preprotein translocase subunit SecA